MKLSWIHLYQISSYNPINWVILTIYFTSTYYFHNLWSVGYIMMLYNLLGVYIAEWLFLWFYNLNNYVDFYQWWMYLMNQLQFSEIFGFLLEFAWEFPFNLSLNWFWDMFLHFSLSSWYFVLHFIWIFVNCNIFCRNIIINFYYFLYEIFIFTDFIYIFVDLVDLWFLAIIRQPNYLGVHMCVRLVYFDTHVFLYGNFNIFSSIQINK